MPFPLALKRGAIFVSALAFALALLAIFDADSSGTSGQPLSHSATVAAGDVVEGDLYLARKIVTIDGTVKGDDVIAARDIQVNGTVEGNVLAAGRDIEVNGTVDGDVLAAGRTIAINGTVADDARIAGGILQLGREARIGDDAIAAGYSWESLSGSAVGHDLKLASAKALLSGSVERDAAIASASVELDGAISGDASLRVGDTLPSDPFTTAQAPIEIPELGRAGLTVTDAARIDGQLLYAAPAPALIDDAAALNEVAYTEVTPPDFRPSPIEFALGRIQRAIALALVGCGLMWLLPSWTGSLTEKVRTRPLASFGWGLVTTVAVGALALLAIPVVAVIASAVLGYILPGFVLPTLSIGLWSSASLLLGFGLFVSFIPQAIACTIGGRWIVRALGRDDTARYLPVWIGVVPWVLVTSIPVIGSALALLAIAIGLGAAWLWEKDVLKQVSDRADLDLGVPPEVGVA
ncbi:MAG: polymer-forming cytoskeletal protein [Cyanobacteria bacterium P01_E01_bin.48]